MNKQITTYVPAPHWGWFATHCLAYAALGLMLGSQINNLFGV